jgi:hypothetical protein
MKSLDPKQERCLEHVYLWSEGLVRAKEQIGASHLVFLVHVNLLVNFRISCCIVMINTKIDISISRTLVWIN